MMACQRLIEHDLNQQYGNVLALLPSTSHQSIVERRIAELNQISYDQSATIFQLRSELDRQKRLQQQPSSTNKLSARPSSKPSTSKRRSLDSTLTPSACVLEPPNGQDDEEEDEAEAAEEVDGAWRYTARSGKRYREYCPAGGCNNDLTTYEKSSVSKFVSF